MNGAARNAARYAPARNPRQTWFTPEQVVRLIRADLGGSIDLDPCPGDVDVDGLAMDWGPAGTRVFCNPPYGAARKPWIEACIWAGQAGLVVALLIPAAVDVAITQYALGSSSAAVFIRGRLGFEQRRPNGIHRAATGPSVVIAWNTELRATSTLGLRMVPA